MARAVGAGLTGGTEGRPRLSTILPPTLVTSAQEALKSSILSGRFALGERLVEVPLSRQLGISRGPLREALNLLEREGLVEIVPRRGRFVTSFTETKLDEHYSLRQVLETYAVGQVIVTMNPRKRRVLEAGMKRMREAAASTDGLRLSLTDLAFHDSLYQLAESDLLLKVWHETLAGKLRLLVNITGKTHAPMSTLANHERIAAAIVRGDATTAAGLVRDHVDDAWRRAKDALSRRGTER